MAPVSAFQASSAKSEGGAGAEEELAAVAAPANSPAAAKEAPAGVETRLFLHFLRVSVTRVCDSRPLATRIGSLRSPLDSSYSITPSSIFPGFTTLLLAPQAAPSSFRLFQSLFQSRLFPALFPALWLGLFRFPHVFPYSFTRLTCPGRSCSHRVALLPPFSPLAYSLCCRCVDSHCAMYTRLFSVLQSVCASF